MKSELVSIIIPVYNVESYIQAALQSAVNQTYENIEVIVVNDGTRDHSMEKVQHFLCKDTRVSVINRFNGGLSTARNIGLDACKGEYVLFFDSDDRISPTLVEQSVNSAQMSQADVVVFGFDNIRCDKEENILSVEKYEFENITCEEMLNKSEIPPSFLSGIGFAWNKLYRTRFLRNHQLHFEEGLSLIEDVVFNREVFLCTDRVTFLSGTYYQYYARERATLSNQFYEGFMDLFIRGFRCRSEILHKFYPHAGNGSEYLARNYVNGIRFYCSMLFKHGQKLSVSERIHRLKRIVTHSVTKEQIAFFKPYSRYDRLIKLCIQYRLVRMLYMLYRIRFR